MNPSKRIVVFGATGGIGGHVVRQALSMNHHVTAVVRAQAPFALAHSALDVIRVPELFKGSARLPE